MKYKPIDIIPTIGFLTLLNRNSDELGEACARSIGYARDVTEKKMPYYLKDLTVLGLATAHLAATWTAIYYANCFF